MRMKRLRREDAVNASGKNVTEDGIGWYFVEILAHRSDDLAIVYSAA